MSTAVLERVEQLAHLDSADREADYRQLVQDLAAGQDRDAGDALKVCERVGASMDELRRDVERRIERLALAEQAASYGVAESARQKAKADLDRLQAEQEQILSEFKVKIAAARRAIEFANQEQRLCREAQRELRRTATPALLEEAERLNRAAAEAEQRRARIAKDLAAATQRAQEAEAEGIEEWAAAEARRGFDRAKRFALDRGADIYSATDAANAAVRERAKELAGEMRTGMAKTIERLRAELAEAEAEARRLLAESEAAEQALLVP